MLETGRDFAAHKRHSVYNIQRLYLDFLEALDMREDTLPGDATRGELVFYQLGKFSQVISDFEQIHFTTEPKAKYEGFAKWLEHQAPGYYADADADVGYATPDAVTIATVHQAEGAAVAGGVPAGAAQEPVPVTSDGRRHASARHPGRGDRRPGPVPRHSRGRDAAVLRRRDPGAEVPLRDVLAGGRQPAAADPLGRSSTTSPRSSGSRRPRRRSRATG